MRTVRRYAAQGDVAGAQDQYQITTLSARSAPSRQTLVRGLRATRGRRGRCWMPVTLLSAIAALAIGCGDGTTDSSENIELPPVDEFATEVSPTDFDELTVTTIWARPADLGANTAIYLVLENHLPTDDRIVEVFTTDAEASGLHQTVADGDMLSMRPAADGIPVPADGEARLEPGGYHIMLEGLTRSVNEGDSLGFILGLENYGNLALEAEVRREPPPPAP